MGKKILVVDDHPMVAAAVKSYLSESELISHIDAVSTTKEALQWCKEHLVDLVILDIELEDSDGFSLYKKLLSNGYEGKALFLSAKSDLHYVRLAVKLRSQGFINKTESLKDIVSAVEMIIKGFTFFPQQHHEQEQMTLDSILTEREISVMQYLLEGKSNMEIADILFISNKTVSTYKVKIFNKLGVNSTVMLAKVINERF
ncbi:response regulator transcription factor [Pseudoalteromonas haloplanktis]|uniref:Response regulator transcription factor n=1 Tax=Pseudoalteromonas haloplanktis TaxID=228 RepID=A0ABU1B9U7_PSEHA|nr:response regulator transcription factor [Pseudoalteromonas haloplanktis]MDQ9091293.1 response regulator transcription factor [Pseudoalteromonas haloplanktis]